jgi:hypothetical protein
MASAGHDDLRESGLVLAAQTGADGVAVPRAGDRRAALARAMTTTRSNDHHRSQDAPSAVALIQSGFVTPRYVIHSLGAAD